MQQSCIFFINSSIYDKGTTYVLYDFPCAIMFLDFSYLPDIVDEVLFL